MVQIKNYRLLDGMDQSSIDMINYACTEHFKHGNITFKIIENSDTKVILQAVQGKNSKGIYQTQQRLVEIGKETFGRFFTDKKLLIHGVPYVESPVNKVDHAWINKSMKKTGTKLKDISNDTGIDYSYLSELVNGGSLSQSMKAMFYYYFQTKKLETISNDQSN